MNKRLNHLLFNLILGCIVALCLSLFLSCEKSKYSNITYVNTTSYTAKYYIDGKNVANLLPGESTTIRCYDVKYMVVIKTELYYNSKIQYYFERTYTFYPEFDYKITTTNSTQYLQVL